MLARVALLFFRDLLLDLAELRQQTSVALLFSRGLHRDHLTDSFLLLEQVILSGHLNHPELGIIPLQIDLIGLSLHPDHLVEGILLLKHSHLVVFVVQLDLLEHAVLL